MNLNAASLVLFTSRMKSHPLEIILCLFHSCCYIHTACSQIYRTPVAKGEEEINEEVPSVFIQKTTET